MLDEQIPVLVGLMAKPSTMFAHGRLIVNIELVEISGALARIEVSASVSVMNMVLLVVVMPPVPT